MKKFMVLPLILLVVSIVLLGYMDISFKKLLFLLLPFCTGWWVRGNMD